MEPQLTRLSQVAEIPDLIGDFRHVYYGKGGKKVLMR